MSCLLDASNCFLKQLDSVATWRYLKELVCTKHNITNDSIDTVPQKAITTFEVNHEVFHANKPIFHCGVLVTANCSLGMLMFTFIYSPIA